MRAPLACGQALLRADSAMFHAIGWSRSRYRPEPGRAPSPAPGTPAPGTPATAATPCHPCVSAALSRAAKRIFPLGDVAKACFAQHARSPQRAPRMRCQRAASRRQSRRARRAPPGERGGDHGVVGHLAHPVRAEQGRQGARLARFIPLAPTLLELLQAILYCPSRTLRDPSRLQPDVHLCLVLLSPCFRL